jgi:hypothetical protein
MSIFDIRPSRWTILHAREDVKMPNSRVARRQDSVIYRTATGKTRAYIVLADTKAPTVAPASSTSTTGGTLAAATYSYRIAWVYGTLVGAPGPAKTQVTTGATSTVTIDVTGQVPSGTAGATAWRIYGRTGGSELLMGTVSLPTLTFLDDGSATPSGALPTDTGNVNLKRFQQAVLQNIAKASTMRGVTPGYFNR